MGLFDHLDGADARPTDSQRNGVVRDEVIENLDLTMQGRVQVKIPTIPDVEPWAAVCAPFAFPAACVAGAFAAALSAPAPAEWASACAQVRRSKRNRTRRRPAPESAPDSWLEGRETRSRGVPALPKAYSGW